MAINGWVRKLVVSIVGRSTRMSFEPDKGVKRQYPCSVLLTPGTATTRARTGWNSYGPSLRRFNRILVSGGTGCRRLAFYPATRSHGDSDRFPCARAHVPSATARHQTDPFSSVPTNLVHTARKPFRSIDIAALISVVLSPDAPPLANPASADLE